MNKQKHSSDSKLTLLLNNQIRTKEGMAFNGWNERMTLPLQKIFLYLSLYIRFRFYCYMCYPGLTLRVYTRFKEFI